MPHRRTGGKAARNQKPFICCTFKGHLMLPPVQARAAVPAQASALALLLSLRTVFLFFLLLGWWRGGLLQS